MTVEEMKRIYKRVPKQEQIVPDSCVWDPREQGKQPLMRNSLGWQTPKTYTTITSLQDARIDQIVYQCHVQTEKGLAKLLALGVGNEVIYMILKTDGTLAKAEDL